MAGTMAARLSRLHALIDHPRTGDAEGAAAQRMLDRILARSRPPQNAGDRTYGQRHHRVGRHADLTRIAEMVREEIALARLVFSTPGQPGLPAESDPIADAPAGIVYTVSTPHDSEVVITLENVPQAWGWVSEYGVETASSALRALVDELADLLNGYNRDGVEIGKRFFGRVRVGDRTLVW
ncbi:hypothetical protein [Rhodococcus artemisiae]|uniref:Uncharacterized protein n=1 Tax=Rhodococcus artemisiae TaxID=714159 RepID=A0ABU7LEI9_9NOCA|nr:hypothetical protein [Rhodococcus artemisiae]MEE2059979.1 hypothetical protein [Rhodococcus artemisiae]